MLLNNGMKSLCLGIFFILLLFDEILFPMINFEGRAFVVKLRVLASINFLSECFSLFINLPFWVLSRVPQRV
ncbi:hypothetical protein CMI46_00685 [Candidatus Pacearchaeota archaeon]|nr:hypothetical protein [Candidatus Pacearchaeota archaeon]